LSRVRKVARDGADVTPGAGNSTSETEGQQPKLLGCQQWSGEPEAERGSRYRKRDAVGDFEGWQRN